MGESRAKGADFSVMTWATAATIPEVLDRMAAIESALPREDGVAQFSRMYHQVTRLVDGAVDRSQFISGEFLTRLDINFANIFFAAYAADAGGYEVPRAWRPLFEARRKPRTLPIQFALAGMNAHIGHDLPVALVSTCHEMGLVPHDETPQHTDFQQVNRVLAEAAETIKGWFITGVLAHLDQAAGHVDDRFEMFALVEARSAAWDTSQLLWGLSEHDRMDDLFRRGLARTIELAGRGILL